MSRICAWPIFIFLFLLLHSSCIFGPNRISGVRTFSRHEVFLGNGVRYRIGELPSSWKRAASKAKVAAFYQPSIDGTMYTSAFCGKQFEDVRLAELARQLERGLEDRSKAKHSKVLLGSHEALRTEFQGKLDGQPVAVQAVVFKQALCTFDFVLIQNTQISPQVLADFEHFYQGFVLLPRKIPSCPVKRWCS